MVIVVVVLLLLELVLETSNLQFLPIPSECIITLQLSGVGTAVYSATQTHPHRPPHNQKHTVPPRAILFSREPKKEVSSSKGSVVSPLFSNNDGGVHHYDVERLLREGGLFFNETSSHPKCCVFLLDRENDLLREQVKQQMENSKINRSTNVDGVDWFERELANISAAKEPFENFYGYLQDLDCRTLVGMEELNFHHRWSLYQPSPVKVLYLKVWNGEEYEPSSLLGLSVRNLIVKGKEQTVGYIGSLWISEKYRTNQTFKFILWSMHLDIASLLKVKYCYGLVMVKNEKSFGYLQKTGIIPSEQILHRVIRNIYERWWST